MDSSLCINIPPSPPLRPVAPCAWRVAAFTSGIVTGAAPADANAEREPRGRDRQGQLRAQSRVYVAYPGGHVRLPGQAHGTRPQVMGRHPLPLIHSPLPPKATQGWKTARSSARLRRLPSISLVRNGL